MNDFRSPQKNHGVADIFNAMPTALILAMAICLLAAANLFGQTEPLQQPPGKTELKAAVTSIRGLFKTDYQNSSPEGRTKLLAKLQKVANETADDSVNQYALLSECVFAATNFGAVAEGWSACDAIDSSYDVDVLPHASFIRNIRNRLNQQSASLLYSQGVATFELLIAEDRYTDAGELIKALQYALKAGMPNAKKELKTMALKAKSLDRKFEELQSSLDALEKNPHNERANAAVGMFYCQVKQDFERGIAHLSNSSVGELQQLAELELSLEDPPIKTRLKVSNFWWNAGAEKESNSFQILAARQYLTIVDDLKGLTKIEVEKRISEALPRARMKISTLLSSSAWRVKWSNGTVWENLRMENGKVSFKYTSGQKVQMSYRELGGATADLIRDANQPFYRISQKDGIQLNLKRMNVKGEPESGTAIGTKVTN